MSEEQKLIASVRRALDAFSRGDFDSAVEIADPDIELVTTGGFTELRGADEFRAWMEPMTVENASAKPEHFEVAGRNVLVRQTVRGRGLTSGISLEGRNWAVFTFNKAGLATRLVLFRENEEARARQAAGPSE